MGILKMKKGYQYSSTGGSFFLCIKRELNFTEDSNI